MKTIRIILAISFALFVIAPHVLAMGLVPQPPDINQIANQIQAEMNSMDSDLAQAAQQLSSEDLTSDNTQSILQNLYTKHLSIIDVVTISPDGNLLMIKPDKYAGSIGQNISYQAHFIKFKKTLQPVLGDMFKAVEGFWAVTLAYPVFAANGQLKGCVSLVIQPDALIRNVVKQYDQKEFKLEFFALQMNGTVIYDKDIMQVGKNIFTDPLYQPYPDLLRFTQTATEETNGKGAYTFTAPGSTQAVTKSATWTTIGLHGTEWRLVIAKISTNP